MRNFSAASLVVAKHPGKDRIDMLGMIAQVEFLVDLFLGQGRADLFIG